MRKLELLSWQPHKRRFFIALGWFALGALLLGPQTLLLLIEGGALGALAEELTVKPATFEAIALNNLRVMLISAATFWTVVVPVAIFMLNAALVGAFATLSAATGLLPQFAVAILPHGVVEVSAFALELSLLYELGKRLWLKVANAVKRRLGREAGDVELPSVRYVATRLGLAAALIVAAAFIEVYVTPALFHIVFGGK